MTELEQLIRKNEELEHRLGVIEDVNAIRRLVPSNVAFVKNKVTGIALTPDRQTLTLSGSEQVSARLVVGGDSAGGNLSAVVALNAREHGPKIAGQVLIYPATDFRMSHPSHSEPETSCLLTHSVIRWFRDHYLNTLADGDGWRASPARAESLKGLPPAYVLTAGADPLRDEGDEYAARLMEAEIPVTHITYPGQFHGFITMGKLLPRAGEALTDIAGWLRALN